MMGTVRSYALLLLLPVVLAGARPAAPEVVVGSKKFTESVILGEVARQLVAAAGVEARHRSELGGTRVLWNALLAGDVDVYPEYTGTLVQEILAAEAATAAGLDSLLARQGVRMTPPLGFNNTYALGMRAAQAERLGIRTISDLRQHPALRLGFSNEFMDRADGWPGLRGHYALPHADVRGLDHDLAYRGLAGGTLDVTDLYATDAEIAAYDLRVLEDDRGFFPDYHAVLLYRADLAARAPGAVAALHRLAGRISDEAMIRMNARARLDGQPERGVAAGFLREAFGQAGPAGPAGATWVRRVAQRTREHLTLVLVSLLAAIVVALPLGVVAARRPRTGQVILGVVGVLYTIPSLALLVFMIPLLGIGGPPAVVALFLYSLLPIVRNTHAGLRGIPPELLASADALGLPPGARLRRVELPLALPSILAGIKTSAVINIGTATLGALIGAGGYGQPILTGIRLADTSLILEGAVPAALLALAAQGLFDLVERFAVSPGLRADAG